MPLRRQLIRQMRGRLGRPPQRPHRIAPRPGIDQQIQRRDDPRVQLGDRHAAGALAEAVRDGVDGLPVVRIADKVLQGVTCIRLDATVTPAGSDKELAEPDFKGLCDVMPLAVSERVGGGQ